MIAKGHVILICVDMSLAGLAEANAAYWLADDSWVGTGSKNAAADGL